MKPNATIVMAIVAVALLAGPTLADWDLFQDPYKYYQLVDPRVQQIGNGIGTPVATAVDISDQLVADDFPCDTTGPITSVHIWGSRENPASGEPALGGLWVGFHDNIPAAGQTPSQPGLELWRAMIPFDFIQTRTQTGPIGHWYEPMGDPHWRQINLTATQYNIDLEGWARENNEELFLQQGTSDEPKVYWLSIEANYLGGANPNNGFGWVSSNTDWEDDAAWLDSTNYTGTPTDSWTDIHYELYDNVNGFHPFDGQSLNLAFVIVPEPATMVLFGLGAFLLLKRRRQC